MGTFISQAEHKNSLHCMPGAIGTKLSVTTTIFLILGVFTLRSWTSAARSAHIAPIVKISACEYTSYGVLILVSTGND